MTSSSFERVSERGADLYVLRSLIERYPGAARLIMREFGEYGPTPEEERDLDHGKERFERLNE
jgi:hypothetical protein